MSKKSELIMAAVGAMFGISSPPMRDKRFSILNYGSGPRKLGDLMQPRRDQLSATNKGFDRNKPCACGSGIKTKKCCQVMARIVKYDHPALSTRALPCTQDDLKNTDMFNLLEVACRRSPTGAGLAANQVNWLKRVVFLLPDRNRNGLFMINPEITEKEGVQFFQEGCLSYPDFYTEIKRFQNVTVKFLDRDWVEHTQMFEGFDAVVVQHELDHLDGICLVGDAFRRKR